MIIALINDLAGELSWVDRQVYAILESRLLCAIIQCNIFKKSDAQQLLFTHTQIFRYRCHNANQMRSDRGSCVLSRRTSRQLSFVSLPFQWFRMLQRDV